MERNIAAAGVALQFQPSGILGRAMASCRNASDKNERHQECLSRKESCALFEVSLLRVPQSENDRGDEHCASITL